MAASSVRSAVCIDPPPNCMVPTRVNRIVLLQFICLYIAVDRLKNISVIARLPPVWWEENPGPSVGC